MKSPYSKPPHPNRDVGLDGPFTLVAAPPARVRGHCPIYFQRSYMEKISKVKWNNEVLKWIPKGMNLMQVESPPRISGAY